MTRPLDLLILNATIVDGTGAPSRTASVAIRDDTIVAIGDLPQNRASRIVDATGLVLAPGFIDIHTHSDRTLFADPAGDSKLHQGVTTEVIGNCGLSSAPCLVLFSPACIRETSTFQDPHRYAEGVELVMLNGRVVLDGGRHTGARAGQVLRRR